MNDTFVREIVNPKEVKKIMEQVNMKAAFICVTGRYNAGKSTLINALLGSKYASKVVNACLHNHESFMHT